MHVSSDCPACSAPALQRPRFFARQLVTPTELNLAGDYARRRQSMHNRMLHGFGVVCGALVTRVCSAEGTVEPWKVRISEGHLIDGNGDDVHIGEGRVVDLRGDGVTATGEDPPGELSDPWCSDVRLDRGGTVWLAARYRQVPTRKVHTQPSGCDCGGAGCEYSRWCDGYEISFLEACPPSHSGTPPDLGDLVAGNPMPVPDCPPCPDDAWVVLAVVTVDDQGGVTTIDNASCRRMVVSPAPYWWRPRSVPPTITAVTVAPAVYKAGDPVTLTVAGTGFDPKATASLGARVSIKAVTVAGTGDVMTVEAKIFKNAKGDLALRVENPDAGEASWPKALTVP